jgi:hypothetical protein
MLHPLGSPNQNSKTGLNCLHKLYTIKILFFYHQLPGKSGLSQAQYQAVRVVIALFRYKVEKGQFPEKLDELVPQYLQTVPLDPFGPGPLTYKRQSDDFVLYSWGLNFKDYDGQHDPDVFATTKPTGDYVFWPPVE